MSTDLKSHSELPPSSADKWFYCHGWRRTTAEIVDIPSEYAQEGTLAHEWYAGELTGAMNLVDLDDKIMSDHLFMCTEWIREQAGELLVEEQVDYGATFGFVNLTGTVDNILVHPKHLTIADLKYGKNVIVEVENNLQLMCYLIGAIHKFGQRQTYRLVILQPRAYHPKGPIREWFVSNAEVMEFRLKLEEAIEGNFNPKSKPVVGEYCRHWCKALGRCPAAAEKSLELFRLLPDEEDE